MMDFLSGTKELVGMKELLLGKRMRSLVFPSRRKVVKLAFEMN